MHAQQRKNATRSLFFNHEEWSSISSLFGGGFRRETRDAANDAVHLTEAAIGAWMEDRTNKMRREEILTAGFVWHTPWHTKAHQRAIGYETDFSIAWRGNLTSPFFRLWEERGLCFVLSILYGKRVNQSRLYFLFEERANQTVGFVSQTMRPRNANPRSRISFAACGLVCLVLKWDRFGLSSRPELT